MKSILYITAFPPNCKSGGQIFSLNTIKNLSKKYTIDLIYFTYKGHDCDAVRYVRNIKKWNCSLSNCLKHINVYPLFTRRFDTKILHYIKEVMSNYDILYFDYTQVALYSLYLKHPNKIIRCHDVMAQKFSRQCCFLLPWIKYTEKKILKSANKIFVPSEKDADLLQKTYGIKAQYTHEYLYNFDLPQCIAQNNYYIFYGLWSRKENLEGLVWFVEKVLPLINVELKSSFLVMGGGLSDNIKKKYLDKNNIKYLGFVKDNFDAIVQCSAVIVPLFEGAGVKVKVLDSFTTGTPVIGTDIAFEGIPEVKGLMYKAQRQEMFANIINNFKPLELQDKIKLQRQFIQLYDNHHLADYL